MLLNQGDRVVFFGDSITQAHPGYVSFIGDMLRSLYPELQIEVINKGVGGDKVTSLLARVERDVIAEDPDWVSVSIGINDLWHGENGVPLGEYEEKLDELLRILKARTSATILLCTPSVMNEDPDSDENAKLKGYVEASERVGAKHRVTIVPIHDAFIRGLRRARGTTDKALFTTDGVHLNPAGAALFGTTWLKTAGAFEDLLPETA